MTEHIGRPSRNGSIMRNGLGKGLPSNVDHIAGRDVPIRNADPTTEYTFLDSLIQGNPEIKKSPEYAKVNVPKYSPPPRPKPQMILPEVRIGVDVEILY